MTTPSISVSGSDGNFIINVRHEGRAYEYAAWDRAFVDSVEHKRRRHPFLAWNIVKKSCRMIAKQPNKIGDRT